MVSPRDSALVLVRLSGEVSTKARATRGQFVTRLVRNLKDAMAAEGARGRVERHYDRLFVSLDRPEAASALSRVFGVQSLSRVEQHPGKKLDEIVSAGEELFRDRVAGRSFAVRARFVGSREGRPFRSRDLEVALGERLGHYAERVDLRNPEVTAHVEIHRGQAYLFGERTAGPAGLPIGTENRALSLISGGFDSAVASWQLLRRGVNLDYAFCNLGGWAHRLGTLRVVKTIADRWSYGSRPRLHAVDFQEVSRELQSRTDSRYWQVILKRLMLRAAEQIVDGTPACAIVTGESVGQVSSQTLVNLAVISEATRIPILRPLVGTNKAEIIARAEEIGTGALSAVVDEYCALTPRRPATSAKLDVVREQESRLEPDTLSRAVAEREVIDLHSIDPDDTGLPAIEIAEVPEDARVVDLRSRAQFAQWHFPGAIQLDVPRALEAFPSFSPESTYVLYCDFGLKSAHLAELMSREGLRAFHFRGGTRALRDHLASQER
jgi:thiamine biosynthesis protein ThiI